MEIAVALGQVPNVNRWYGHAWREGCSVARRLQPSVLYSRRVRVWDCFTGSLKVCAHLLGSRREQGGHRDRRQPGHRRRDRAAGRAARLRRLRQLSKEPGGGRRARVGDIQAAGGTALAVGADVASRPTSCDCSKPWTRQLGPLTCAGQQCRHPGETDPRRADRRGAHRSRVRHQRARRLSLRSRSGAAAVDQARRRGGAIVNVSSRAAQLGAPGEYVDYAASKAALDALTIGLAREVAAEGIRVNGVRAGHHLHRDSRRRRRAEPRRSARADAADAARRRGDRSRAGDSVAAVGGGVVLDRVVHRRRRRDGSNAKPALTCGLRVERSVAPRRLRECYRG